MSGIRKPIGITNVHLHRRYAILARKLRFPDELPTLAQLAMTQIGPQRTLTNVF